MSQRVKFLAGEARLDCARTTVGWNRSLRTYIFGSGIGDLIWEMSKLPGGVKAVPWMSQYDTHYCGLLRSKDISQAPVQEDHPAGLTWE